MSNIPVSQRTESKLEAIHQAYKIRTMVTNELLYSFAYSEKREDAHIRKATSYIKDPDQKKDMQDTMKAQEYQFDLWLIQQERTVVLNCCREMTMNLIKANSIYPNWMVEYSERRILMDRSINAAYSLEQELQYIAEVLPTDKNRFTNIVLEVDREVNILKGLRQSDNRFLKYIPDAPKRKQKSASTG